MRFYAGRDNLRQGSVDEHQIIVKDSVGKTGICKSASFFGYGAYAVCLSFDYIYGCRFRIIEPGSLDSVYDIGCAAGIQQRRGTAQSGLYAESEFRSHSGAGIVDDDPDVRLVSGPRFQFSAF